MIDFGLSSCNSTLPQVNSFFKFVDQWELPVTVIDKILYHEHTRARKETTTVVLALRIALFPPPPFFVLFLFIRSHVTLLCIARRLKRYICMRSGGSRTDPQPGRFRNSADPEIYAFWRKEVGIL